MTNPVCPVIQESITTGVKTTSNLSSQSQTDYENSVEEKLSAKEAELDLMWDKIQELKLTDEFAAQILYVKYKKLTGELPPPVPCPE